MISSLVFLPANQIAKLIHDRQRPSGAKGHYWRSIYVSFTLRGSQVTVYIFSSLYFLWK